jgi:predicted component of viral defense system (DUF524 family)
MESKQFININLDHIEKGLQLSIDARADDTLFIVSDAIQNGEAPHQLVEGFMYDYELNLQHLTIPKDQIVQPHSRKKYLGTISPNIYVGTLKLPIVRDNKEIGNALLEVRSVKAGYRNDYRDMLELITEKCTELLMEANSPVSHNFETDFETDNETLYQKFAFIKSIIATDEFSESVHRIVSAPVTQWKETPELKDVRNIRRFNNSNIKELIVGSNRSPLPENHYLQNYGMQSVSNKIASVRKTDTVDTPENRFVKFALESFLRFCSVINKKAVNESRLWHESGILEKELESYLHHSVFKKISHPETLRLNSPVLQRKEGYREVLRVWLMFDLAAKLVWKGGDDVYSGGKKDIATLYEYWLFFKLLDLFKSIFDIEPKEISELIKETNDGLSLQLKQGNHTALSGIYDASGRRLNIRFNYNRQFDGKKDYPLSGSWTTTMRPDYTLSFWPNGITETEAELQELIVHIHFDAKYKIANLTELLKNDAVEDFEAEKKDSRKGIYKNADLLKMHAYRDAIRRTGGAYVLYPGYVPVSRSGFHEIIPGLGAFPVRPSKTDDGINELKSFVIEVVNHFLNRASQREKIAFKAFDVYKNKPHKGDIVKDALPETIGENRNLIPDETFVLVGYYRKENLDWIIKSGLYNARAHSKRGLLRLGPEEAGAKYLLLHTSNETKTSRIFKITETGPRVFSKQTLIDKGYQSDPTQDYYLVYKIQEVTERELLNQTWDITMLDKYGQRRNSALPFTVSLSELMKAKIK